MPDLLAGTIITANDFPAVVQDREDGFFSFNATAAYGIDADSGTYNDCGVTFIGPTTGRVWISYNGALVNDTAGAFTIMAPFVRTGTTVGAGTTVLAATDEIAVYMFGTATMSMGRTYLLSGLTGGSSYNVRLEHKVGSGIGTIGRRVVMVAPAS